jgi:hypothetical protein
MGAPEGVCAALQLALPAAARLQRLAQRLRALIGIQNQQRPQLHQQTNAIALTNALFSICAHACCKCRSAAL